MTYHEHNWLKIRPGDILLETYDTGSMTYLVLKTDITFVPGEGLPPESRGLKALILHDNDWYAALHKKEHPWNGLGDIVGSTLNISYHAIHQGRDCVRWKKEFETDD